MNDVLTRAFGRLTAAAFLAAVLIPVFATAQAGQASAPPEQIPARTMRPCQALGITPEQEKALEAFRTSRMKERQAFREEMAKIRAEMRELAKDPGANDARIDALIDRSAALRAGREKEALRNRAERDNIFTPEQLERMKAFRARLADRPGVVGRGRLDLGRAGFRGPGRFRGCGLGARPMERLRALRCRPCFYRRGW